MLNLSFGTHVRIVVGAARTSIGLPLGCAAVAKHPWQ
jgi:hypothetical protein